MNKNIVTQEQVDENMKDVLCRTEMEWGHPVTYVSVRMKNGFVVRASTTCVDPANYDEEYGKQICLEKIEDQIWELLGYALREQVYQASNKKRAGDVLFEPEVAYETEEPEEEPEFEFPKFISGGLYLVGANKNNLTAWYYRSRLTGAWGADVTYKNGKLILEVSGIIEPHEVFPISLEEFIQDNGRGIYSLEKLTDGKYTTKEEI